MRIKTINILTYLQESNFEYDYYGKIDISINGYSSLQNIKSDSITWIKDESYYKDKLFYGLKNVLVVSSPDIKIKEINNDDIGFIICRNPKEIFFTILNRYFGQEKNDAFISPDSVIMSKKIGQGVCIGNNCYIGPDVIIGDNVVIKNNVSIEGNTKIGNNTVIHSGVVIGTDGFGYFKNNKGKNIKVPHYGGVIIGDDVEIGANTCIDRGTLDDTVIGNNVKISNLCHIAHNVKIHDCCVITAGVVITGSTVIGKNTYIAPGAKIKNQLTIGENSLIGMGAVVLTDVEENKVVVGIPAKVIREKCEGGK